MGEEFQKDIDKFETQVNNTRIQESNSLDHFVGVPNATPGPKAATTDRSQTVINQAPMSKFMTVTAVEKGLQLTADEAGSKENVS